MAYPDPGIERHLIEKQITWQNIIYGVSGEGFGHSSRAREMLSHLEKIRATPSRVVSYDKGYPEPQGRLRCFLRPRASTLPVPTNKVSIAKNPDRQHEKNCRMGIKKLRALRHEGFEKFKPDCVITDFEPMTAYLANHYHIPLITIDNQHRMRYMDYPYPPKTQKRAIDNRERHPRHGAETGCLAGYPPSISESRKTTGPFIFPPIFKKRGPVT